MIQPRLMLSGLWEQLARLRLPGGFGSGFIDWLDRNESHTCQRVDMAALHVMRFIPHLLGRTLVGWNQQSYAELRTLRALEVEALQEKVLASHESELTRLSQHSIASRKSRPAQAPVRRDRESSRLLPRRLGGLDRLRHHTRVLEQDHHVHRTRRASKHAD